MTATGKLEKIKQILDYIDEEDLTTAEYQILKVLKEEPQGVVPAVCQENSHKLAWKE